MRARTIVLLGLCAVLLAVPLAGVWLASQALQAAPLNPLPQSQAQSRQASAVQRLFDKSMLRQLISGQQVRIALPAADANTVANDVVHRVVGGSARLDLSTPGHARIWLSVPVQRTPLRSLAALGNWLNVQALLAQTAIGPPKLLEVRIGSLALPLRWVQWGVDQAASHYQLQDEMAVALKSVQSVQMQPEHATVTLHWPPSVKGQALGVLIPPRDLDSMRAYQAELSHLLNQAQPGTAQVRLIDLMQPLFLLAQQRSMGLALAGTGSPGQNTAQHENRAALLVLASYVAHLPLNDALPTPPDWPQGPPLMVTLHGRQDFAMHFLLSALLASGLGGQITEVIGMYKEMADTQGGSGFSFNDIAADKAGIRFGQRAHHQPLELQMRVAQGQSDDFYMPQVDDMPEFVSAQDFRTHFEGRGKQVYEHLLLEIDRRVSALGVLR